MKKVRCPKCDNFIIFDETKYKEGQSLIFQCPDCGKQFGIKIGLSKLKDKNQSNGPLEGEQEENNVGFLTVIENVFCFRQTLPLVMGDNIIGRYQKGQNIQCPIESSDPSIDMHHCVLTVQRDKNKNLQYVLRDGPSFTGTFVKGELLGLKEKRVIENGTLVTIGATSFILQTKEEKS
jgi:hypothetical protein